MRHDKGVRFWIYISFELLALDISRSSMTRQRKYGPFCFDLNFIAQISHPDPVGALDPEIDMQSTKTLSRRNIHHKPHLKVLIRQLQMQPVKEFS